MKERVSTLRSEDSSLPVRVIQVTSKIKRITNLEFVKKIFYLNEKSRRKRIAGLFTLSFSYDAYAECEAAILA